MKNRIKKKVKGSRHGKLVKTERSGDVVVRNYADGTAIMTIYGETFRRLDIEAKRQGVTYRKLVTTLLVDGFAKFRRRHMAALKAGRAA